MNSTLFLPAKDGISPYTHSLVPADFSGAVFTCAFFQKMLFLLYKLKNAFLVTNDFFKWCGFGSCRFLPDLKKCTSQGPGVKHYFRERACFFLACPDLIIKLIFCIALKTP